MKRMDRVRWKKDRVTRLSTKQVITNDTELYSVRPFLKTKYDHCMMCDGFYGNNFGEPVCLTCHLFLFCNDIDKDDAGIDAPQYKEKADSDDSGNEEPDALTDFYMLPDDHPPKMQKMASSTNRQMDKLAERIACLTIPRDTDKEVVLEGLVDTLPPEVLLVVFRYLDDISLWNASNVCMRWRQIVDAETTGDQWERFIHLRWPLFKAQYKVHSWKTVYAKLLESSPCRYCIDSMMLQSTPPIEENSWRHRRLRSELKALKTDPPEGIQATPLDRHCCHWQASITGPHASPYQGGLFLLYLQIPHSYPMRPPKVRVLTKIFHPNISRHGDVSLDSIQHNWSLALTISKVLISIQSLLTDPYCHVSMEPGIGKLYCENRPEFERIARLWTWKYAMHDFILPCDISLNEV